MADLSLVQRNHHGQETNAVRLERGLLYRITATYPKPARNLPLYRYSSVLAPVCRPPPRQNITQPIVMVHRLPKKSPDGPPHAAPAKAPAVNKDTTSPLSNSQAQTPGLLLEAHLSVLSGENLVTNEWLAMTSAITPRSSVRSSQLPPLAIHESICVHP